MNLIYFLKALHIVGFVAWFAGLFYLVRIFVYHVEARERPQPEQDILTNQFNLMEWRVYKIIANPAMMLTWTAGLLMLLLPFVNPAYPNYLSSDVGTPGWMHLKLLLLALLTGYHLWCKGQIKKLEAVAATLSAFRFRLANELPTLFLVAIAYIAVFGKAGTLRYSYLFFGMALFTGLLYFGARAYKNRREKIG
ncbi:MAG TPA: CopD family protein [Saprospiraceae bacterium]|nr:CopD family protein [Saprospiraceae bacterium]HMP26103.1 CopD family protein [Saprospiraceae bacterium]